MELQLQKHLRKRHIQILAQLDLKGHPILPHLSLPFSNLSPSLLFTNLTTKLINSSLRDICPPDADRCFDRVSDPPFKTNEFLFVVGVCAFLTHSCSFPTPAESAAVGAVQASHSQGQGKGGIAHAHGCSATSEAQIV